MTLSDYLAQPNVTASALARKLGVAHSTVLRWADGSNHPTLDGLRRLHEATNGAVAPNDFLASMERMDAQPTHAARDAEAA